ncbi:MAG: hypothetical protein ACOYM2_16590, partial [Rectinemataceae bacterium]
VSKDQAKKFLKMPDKTALHIKPTLQYLMAFGPQEHSATMFPEFHQRYFQVLLQTWKLPKETLDRMGITEEARQRYKQVP